MNSIRRRIEWQRKAILDSCVDGNIPDICKRDIPPEMPGDFMARADEIRIGAKAALDNFRSNEDYIYLKTHQGEVNPKESKRISIENVLWYADGLEKAIDENDILSMRLKVHYEHYLDSFSRCRKDMETIFAQRAAEPQLSLFSADAPQAGLDFSDSDEEYEDEELEISM